MVKMIFTMRRKAGMSRAAFIDHYERRHVPLALGFMPSPSVYRRNYVTGEEGDAFDVVTEIVYATPEEAARAQAIMTRPDVAATIRADEDRFVEPGSVRSYLVETYDSGTAPVEA
jgi:hypothetical protein